MKFIYLIIGAINLVNFISYCFGTYTPSNFNIGVGILSTMLLSVILFFIDGK